MSYGLQAFKLIAGLLILTLTLRLLGKQTIAQITPYDLVYIIVFGGILDSTFYDDEIGMMPLIFSVLVWSITIYGIEFLVRRFRIFRVFFRGTPDHIISDGNLNIQLFNKNNMEMEQLRFILRQEGIFSLKEVKDVYLEPDGSFSIIKYADYQPVVNSTLDIEVQEEHLTLLLIDQGKIEKPALKQIEKSEEWLKGELKNLGVYDISEILYCEWSESNGFYYKVKPDFTRQKEQEFVN